MPLCMDVHRGVEGSVGDVVEALELPTGKRVGSSVDSRSGLREDSHDTRVTGIHAALSSSPGSPLKTASPRVTGDVTVGWALTCWQRVHRRASSVDHVRAEGDVGPRF